MRSRNDVKPASEEARKIKRKLDGIDRRIENREAEIKVMQDARGVYWRRWVAAQFGLSLGMRVWTDLVSIYGAKPKRREYVVESIREDNLGSGGRPWITGRLVLKDGTVSKTVTHPLYESWHFMGKSSV